MGGVGRFIIETPLCKNCENPTPTLMHFYIRRDGTRQYVWYCTKCQRQWSPNGGSGYFIPHDDVERLLAKLTPKAKEKFDNDRCLADDRVRCDVCGALGAQSHHFAPQSLRAYFGDDFEKYAKANLCEYHHRLWHETVTWYLPGYNRRKDEFLLRYSK